MKFDVSFNCNTEYILLIWTYITFATNFWA